jgi:hypothetical protein
VGGLKTFTATLIAIADQLRESLRHRGISVG